jgi:outer membrane immunogenic protein
MNKWFPTYVAFGILTATGSVLAADMPLKAPPPMMQPHTNWGGCYIGGYGGGAWDRDGATFTDLGPSTAQTNGFLSYGGGSSASRLVGPHSWNVDTGNSGIFGATAGCNWQPPGWSWLVFGVEGEVGYIGLNGRSYDPRTLVGTQTTPDVLGTAKIQPWDGMLTGRIGIPLWDNTLIYVKGGAAFVRTSGAVNDNCQTGVGCGNWAINTQAWKTDATWTLGGGIEWMFAPNWSVKGEYMYIGMDNSNFTSCGTGISPSGTALPGSPYCFNHGFSAIGTAKLGVNFHFN